MLADNSGALSGLFTRLLSKWDGRIKNEHKALEYSSPGDTKGQTRLTYSSDRLVDF